MRKEKNIHYIYKTTCNVTGRWYVGMHSTCNENDGYIGSGLRLRRSIRKYGVENHTKEILEYCNTREELVLREIEIVNSDLIQDDLCMNLKCGGIGGFINEEHKNKFIESSKKSQIQFLINGDEKIRENHRNSSSKRMKQLNLGGKVKYNNRKGINLSEEHKNLLSSLKKGTGTGELNSQYGTCWITNGVENKKIKKYTEIPEGWELGRK